MNETKPLRPFLCSKALGVLDFMLCDGRPDPAISDDQRKQQVADLCLSAEFRMLRWKRDRERMAA